MKFLLKVLFLPSFLQMEFSGLKDTSLTYEDKMQYVATLNKKYGFPVDEKTAAAAVAAAKQE